MDIKDILHEFPSERWYNSEIHSLLRRNGALGSADIIDTFHEYRSFAAYTQ